MLAGLHQPWRQRLRWNFGGNFKFTKYQKAKERWAQFNSRLIVERYACYRAVYFRTRTYFGYSKVVADSAEVLLCLVRKMNESFFHLIENDLLIWSQIFNYNCRHALKSSCVRRSVYFKPCSETSRKLPQKPDCYLNWHIKVSRSTKLFKCEAPEMSKVDRKVKVRSAAIIKTQFLTHFHSWKHCNFHIPPTLP